MGHKEEPLYKLGETSRTGRTLSLQCTVFFKKVTKFQLNTQVLALTFGMLEKDLGLICAICRLLLNEASL